MNEMWNNLLSEPFIQCMDEKWPTIAFLVKIGIWICFQLNMCQFISNFIVAFMTWITGERNLMYLFFSLHFFLDFSISTNRSSWETSAFHSVMYLQLENLQLLFWKLRISRKWTSAAYLVTNIWTTIFLFIFLHILFYPIFNHFSYLHKHCIQTMRWDWIAAIRFYWMKIIWMNLNVTGNFHKIFIENNPRRICCMQCLHFMIKKTIRFDDILPDATISRRPDGWFYCTIIWIMIDIKSKLSFQSSFWMSFFQ